MANLSWKEKYELLVQEANRLNLPRIFRSDLTTHDREYLQKHNPRRFVWLLREHGTNLYADVDPYTLLTLSYHTAYENISHWYSYDNGRLSPHNTGNQLINWFLLNSTDQEFTILASSIGTRKFLIWSEHNSSTKDMMAMIRKEAGRTGYPSAYKTALRSLLNHWRKFNK